MAECAPYYTFICIKLTEVQLLSHLFNMEQASCVIILFCPMRYIPALMLQKYMAIKLTAIYYIYEIHYCFIYFFNNF